MESNNFLSRIILIFVITAFIFIEGCSYSFTGASVPPYLKTIAIPNFSDRSGSGEFNLGENLTNSLIQKFVDDNTLLVTDKLNSDSILEGTIVSLTDAPVVVSGGENISSRRLTITVKATYKDLVKHQTVFEKNFSNYGDYPTDGDLVTARQGAIESAIDKITEDILLGVVSNW